MADSPKKHFTVEEANQTLPLVRAIVADIVRQYSEIREREERLVRLQKSRRTPQRESDSFYADELAQVEQDLDQQRETLLGYIGELEGLGVELKDPAVGLIDFRAMMDGREVYLCWRLGEDEVGFWHELDAGFPGRQSLFAGSLGQPNRPTQPQQPPEVP